ncbi:Putative cytochrome P450 138 [Mycobacterium simulans]|uniref:cytochrome P450 n=1 Tax=Mycobacterium simulans TaxID=627089 RepID=UPI00174BFBD1|nr:cytochrome P450 [Mycobacterium simulans]SON59375.1 Putative cytochrome P450 138 [Mycobacterium simulans]
MSQSIADAAAPPEVRLPPAIWIPKLVQGVLFTYWRPQIIQWLGRRYGNTFTLNIPRFGRVIVVGDPKLARQVFTASPQDIVNIKPNLGRELGSRAVIALDGDDHRQRRRLLASVFGPASVANYETLVEEETLRETANWPEGRSFPTWPSTKQIAINAILRAIFGGDGQGVEFDELRQIVPSWCTLAQRVAGMPAPRRNYGRYSPWGRMAAGRRRYEAIIDKLIDDARADPSLAERTDVLALMLRATHDDGSVMSRKDIGDDLLNQLTAGHESTAQQMSWVFERITRHPDLLAALVEEADNGGAELRQATIMEVQRTRTMVDFSGRSVNAPVFQLGEWVIPRGDAIFVGLAQIHNDPNVFPDPDRFDPQRYIGSKPSAFSWLSFGGGNRRCPGAAFANLEMDVVLRTVLRSFTIETTTAPPEPRYFRGVTCAPKYGGRIVVHRR